MAKQKTVGIGVIGCGGRVRGLLQRLMSENKQFRLVALCDPLPASIEKTLQVTGADPVIYEDHRDLTRDPKVDWVMIGSWNCYHPEHAIAGFKAGKHVFCEKPFATNIRECKRILKAWRESNTLFTIGFTLRYSPHYVAIKRILDRGTIGDIVSLEFNETLHFAHGGHIMSDWRRRREFTGSHLLEKCCHDIDLVQWMVESHATRVASFGGTNFFLPKNEFMMKKLGKEPRSGRPAYLTWEQPSYENPFTGDHDIVDNQVAIIEYANSVRATFHTNLHAGIPERRMYIVGTLGALRSDVIAGTIEVAKVGFKEKVKDMASGVKGGHGGGDEVLCKSLAATMLRGKPPRTSIREGLVSAVTTFGIDKAMETGRTVNMAPLWKQVGIDLEKGHDQEL